MRDSPTVDAEGFVRLPIAQVDEIVDALLFYMRGFTAEHAGTDRETFVPREVLINDLGGRAFGVLQTLGRQFMEQAVERAADAASQDEVDPTDTA
jgi:hypothetical protein